MSLAAIVEALFDAGASKDMIIAAVKAHEAACSVAPVRTARQERNRRYYEAKKASEQRLTASENRLNASESAETSENPLSLPLSPQTPQTPTHTREEKSTTRARSSRRVPESWSPSAKTLQVAADEGFSPGQIERELATMRDHTFATARADWDATFRNWLRRKSPSTPTKTPTQGQRPFHERADHNRKFDRHQSNLERAVAGAEIASRLRAVGPEGDF